MRLARLVVCLLVSRAFAGDIGQPGCYIQAGTVIRARTNDQITTRSVLGGDRVLFEIPEDIRPFRNATPLVRKYSVLSAEVHDARRAGHFVGRARLDLRFVELSTPEGCTYPIDARLIRVNTKHQSLHVREDGSLDGPGHAVRDTVLSILFPPAAVPVLLQLPRRGPDLNLRPEAEIFIRLLQPLAIESCGGSPCYVAAERQPLANGWNRFR